MPTPSAAFSPLTTQKSIPCSARRAGSSRATASRPGRPTTSPTKRMRTRGVRLGDRGGSRMDLDGDVVAVVVRVLRERLALDDGDVRDRAELRAARVDARP